MKYNLKIISILLGMFIFTQLIGILVSSIYLGNSLPYGISPPENNSPGYNAISIALAIFFGIVIMLFLMKYKAEIFLRVWFFVVVSIALAITINALFLLTPFKDFNYLALIAIVPAIFFAYLKVFVRDIRIHNLTELAIYPGVAAIFIPLLNIYSIVILFILISIYDIYAVWHAGFMQKMAKYQIQQVKVFSGFFIPFIGKKEKGILLKGKSKKGKKIKISVAILGGGDVVFPIIMAGVVLAEFGVLSAIIIALGATFALGLLFRFSQKGKYYPAMPFISAGCFIALGVVYLLEFLV